MSKLIINYQSGGRQGIDKLLIYQAQRRLWKSSQENLLKKNVKSLTRERDEMNVINFYQSSEEEERMWKVWQEETVMNLCES